jgi:hypothetical protein
MGQVADGFAGRAAPFGVRITRFDLRKNKRILWRREEMKSSFVFLIDFFMAKP